MKLLAAVPVALGACASMFATVLLLTSCGSGSTTPTTTTSAPTTTPSTPTTTTTSVYAAAYKSVTWTSGVTVAFPSTCSMTVSASGVPPMHDTYYLGPVATGQPIVATTASGIQLGVNAYSSFGAAKAISATFNICPEKAATTTATGKGAIGVITSGEAIFNAYEATNTVATGDNVSYTFQVAGISYTASFIDGCDSHAASMMGGSSWHYHGNPTCWTPTVDGVGASHIIGIALDGFPIYGGRDLNGAVIDPTTLDACNGITSATPEFSTPAYHYVLPIDSTGAPLKTKQSSIGCYAGTANSTLVATMQQLACKMPMLLASGKMRLPDGREVDKRAAAAWAAANMPSQAALQGTPADSPMLMASQGSGKSMTHRM